MPLAAAFQSLKCRVFDAAGAGARFSGGPGVSVALIRANGAILDLSDPAARMFAAARDAGTLADLFLPEDREAVDRAVRSKAVNRLEARARRPGGAIAHVELVLERRADGRAVVLLLDRTREKAAIAEAARDGLRAGAELPDGEAMLADLSHEMRTPLNAVIGFAETIERETFGPVGHENYRQYAEHIRMAGRHLLDLVNAVLDLTKIGADRFALRRVAADPAAIARDCAAMMRRDIEDAGLSFVVEIADDLPETFLDPRATRQILINLLSNAVKFTAAGEVSLVARREDDDIVFIVRDDGVGMSAAALAKIGARLTRAQGPGVRGEGGAGLGLSLAIGLAELHGGGVDLQSAPGEGMTARVRLPIGQAPARGVVRARLSARGSTEADVAAATQLDLVAAARRASANRDAA
jgi:cell cycle sensor histidine kinase DivJ